MTNTKEYHSDTDQDGADANQRFSITQLSVQRQLRKYFLLMPNGSSMALKVDSSLSPVQLDAKPSSCTNNISISDLSLPDHSGWMTWQSGGGKRVWCAVMDMILCVCENDQAERPLEVLLLPGCNIRPLIYKTAINGLKTRSSTNTVTGIGKYQMVIDNCSARRKHIFSVENQASLNEWVNVLENASNLDPESINGMTLDRRSSLNSILQERHRETDDSGCTTPRYIPSSDSSSRVQKVFNCGALETVKTPSIHQNDPGANQQESQFQGQSLQEFRKRLRGLDTEHEQSKHAPIKAQHFDKAPCKESKPNSSKKIRSFGGSLESLLKFRKKKSKKDLIDTSSLEDTTSIDSMSSSGQTSSRSMDSDATTRTFPLATTCHINNSSSTKKSSGKSRSKDTNIIRQASDLKERVITKRDSQSAIRLGDLTDCSIHGHLYCKHLLKWLKYWCAVCRGCFYSFKSQSPQDPPYFAIVLNQCTISILSEGEKKHKRKFVFKLSRPNSKSLYLSAGDNNELSRWVQVLHMEANNVQSDIVNNEKQFTTGHKLNDPESWNPIQTPCVSVSNYSDQTAQENDSEKLKQAPVKPPRKLRYSSCPPTSTTTLTTPNPSVIISPEDCEISESESSKKGNNSILAGPIHSLQSPTHDRAVTHVWQNDRGYLFNVIRSKLKAYKKRKEESVVKGVTTNVGENLLVIDDDNQVQRDERTETDVKGSRDIRRSRSFSSDRKKMEADAAETNGTHSGLRKKHKPLTVRKIPVSELGNPFNSGYLERRIFNGQWIRYWYVLYEQTLYSYLTPDDSVTVDVIDLPNYSVTSLVDKFRGKRFVIQLWHEVFSTVYLSADTREIMTEWCELLVNTTNISDTKVSDDVRLIEGSTCSGCDTTMQNEALDLRQSVKQKLLEEMLRQKYELEKKQAERQRKQKRSGLETEKQTNLNSELTSEEQRMSDVVRLRQRRFSTQIKANTIQKQIQPKKGLFSFGNKKKADESKNMYLKEQLKELTHKLHKIDFDLTQCEKGSTSSDILDYNQNRKYSSRTSFPSDENYVTTSEMDPSMHHTNSLKSAMQKWTARTFSKRKQHKSYKTDEMIGDIFRFRDSVSDYNGYDSQDDSLSDNSVIDLTKISHISKDSDLKLDLSFTDSKPILTSRQRSIASCSSSSSAPSPRREVDPSVMAEIEAFEELTKQVLSARSDRSTFK
ncbi:hypothetical protein CHS0354_000284 [Potamilus streckersoni]|uniref:PH domain-containing protein n=1 Tax=Potamilus streckersoni TaxID=2493646 RepID=A0AAE0RYE3_9BIVA|nr:hypothetical protein CHS0354_000284 [Potamilus streckersoni]